MDYVIGFYEKVESVLPMEGPLAIPARFGIGAAIGWLIGAAVAPEFAYNKDGSKRPWLLLPELYEGKGPGTYLPWLVLPATGGLILSTFI